MQEVLVLVLDMLNTVSFAKYLFWLPDGAYTEFIYPSHSAVFFYFLNLVKNSIILSCAYYLNIEVTQVQLRRKMIILSYIS